VGGFSHGAIVCEQPDPCNCALRNQQPAFSLSTNSSPVKLCGCGENAWGLQMPTALIRRLRTDSSVQTAGSYSFDAGPYARNTGFVLIRTLIFAFIAWIVAKLLRGVISPPSQGAAHPHGGSSGATAASPPPTPEASTKLIACAVCQVRFPEGSALTGSKGDEIVRICSKECRQQLD